MSDNGQTGMDKDTLVNQMNASYERVEAAMAALTPQQWLAPTELGAWSVKDVIAHLTAWLERLVEATDAALSGKPPAHPVANLTNADVDAWNEQIYAERHDETPQAALGAFRRAYGELADKLHLLTWDDLTAVGRFEWMGDISLWRLLAEDTWEHFDEHLPEIEQAAAAEG